MAPFNAARLKVQLKLSSNRLRMLQQKKNAQNAAYRLEISKLLEKHKIDSARIRVEHVIREDFNMEALEITELYCEMLLARFGVIEQMKYGAATVRTGSARMPLAGSPADATLCGGVEPGWGRADGAAAGSSTRRSRRRSTRSATRHNASKRPSSCPSGSSSSPSTASTWTCRPSKPKKTTCRLPWTRSTAGYVRRGDPRALAAGPALTRPSAALAQGVRAAQLLEKLKVRPPDPKLVHEYLRAIATSFNVEYIGGDSEELPVRAPWSSCAVAPAQRRTNDADTRREATVRHARTQAGNVDMRLAGPPIFQPLPETGVPPPGGRGPPPSSVSVRARPNRR